MRARWLRYGGALIAGIAMMGLLVAAETVIEGAGWALDADVTLWVGGAIAGGLGLLVVASGLLRAGELDAPARPLSVGAGLGVAGFLLALGLFAFLGGAGSTGPTLEAVVAEQAFEGNWTIENTSRVLTAAGFGVVETGSGGLAGETPEEDIWVRWLATPNGTRSNPNTTALLTVGYRLDDPEPIPADRAVDDRLIQEHRQELAPRFEELVTALEQALEVQRTGTVSWTPRISV